MPFLECFHLTFEFFGLNQTHDCNLYLSPQIFQEIEIFIFYTSWYIHGFHSDNTVLVKSVINNKKIPLIIFDEAHLLKNENFYELQIITNFNMDSADPAIFILIGQPHLRERLLIPVLQPFNQRIFLKYHLPPLSRDDTDAYIQHHLSLAGLKEPLFDQNAVNAIYQNSGGIPRIINALAIKSMTIGAIEKKNVLTEDDVFRATHEL